ncbi:MAG: apolipoprotein N-acyltransferase [Pseudomonadota bacterium]
MRALSLRISMLTGWRRWALAFVAGAVFSLAQAPFHLVIVGFVCFPLLIWLLDGVIARDGRMKSGMRQAAGIGWWFGFGYFVAGLWWIANALLIEAPEFAWFIPIAVLGLPAILACFYALACALVWPLWSDSLTRFFALGAAFGLAEWLRSFVLTGFPWNAIGYTVMPVPLLMQSVTLVGLFGMSALAVTLFGMPAAFSAARRSTLVSAVVLAVLFAGGHAGFGVWRLYFEPRQPAAENLNVRLVQPDLDQFDKIEQQDPAAQFSDLLTLSTLPSDAPPADLIIWPETAVPFLLTREPAALAAIGDMLLPGQTLITGAVREEISTAEEGGDPRFFNAIMMVDADGIIQGASDKVHLVPFGEYLPLAGFFERLGLRAVAQADRGYSAASSRRGLQIGGINIVPLVCYEVIFPHQLIPGDLILNVTNDAWFGQTPGPYQHMHQARLRAVESGTPLIRVANNGISGIFDSHGRAIAWLGYGDRGAVDENVALSSQPSKYGLGQEYNFWLLLLMMAFISCIGLFRARG